MIELTKGEIDLLNAYNAVHSSRKQHVISLVKQYAEKNAAPKYKYKSNSLRKKREKFLADCGNMIMNGIPGRTNWFQNGYCYIGIDTNWNGHYKIGRTSDPMCRSRESKSINPNYKILYRTRNVYEDSRKLESEIHDLLASKRDIFENVFEWFRLSAEELEVVIKKYDFVKMETLLTSSSK